MNPINSNAQRQLNITFRYLLFFLLQRTGIGRWLHQRPHGGTAVITLGIQSPSYHVHYLGIHAAEEKSTSKLDPDSDDGVGKSCRCWRF